MKEEIAKNIAINKKYLEQNEELIKNVDLIREINEELVKAKEKAEESDRLKSAILANMSHEIRTPMNGILGFADLLRRPELSGEKQEQYLKIIQQSGMRMLDIINDLIDLSAIEADQVNLKLEMVDINLLLDDLYNFFLPEAIHKNLQPFIFDRFRQANVEESINIEGIGLGLSISKAFAEMLGGEIRLESEFNLGSTFFVIHPIK